MNLGLHAGDRGEHEEAIAEIREAVRLQPDHAAIRFVLGNSLFNQGKMNEAIAAYREAIRLDPGLSRPTPTSASLWPDKGSWRRRSPNTARRSDWIRRTPRLTATWASRSVIAENTPRRSPRYVAATSWARSGPTGIIPPREWVRDCERMAVLDARLQAIVEGEAAPAGRGRAARPLRAA